MNLLETRLTTQDFVPRVLTNRIGAALKENRVLDNRIGVNLKENITQNHFGGMETYRYAPVATGRAIKGENACRRRHFTKEIRIIFYKQFPL